MAKEIKLNLTGDSAFDIAEELRFIAERVESGKVYGYPKAPGIFMGNWNVNEVCDVCYGEQKVGEKPCKKCKK